MAVGFVHVNLDLMFALPGQSLDSLAQDLEQALLSGAQQLTFYPLFTFPYTPVGRTRKLRGMGMPPLRQRRRHYRYLHETMLRAGLRRVSVWGFTRTGEKYSSVTRDRYIGLGPGAASCLPGHYLFNTFSLLHYQRRLGERRFATALAMPLTEAMERYYWLYWRLYETEVPIAGLHARFTDDRRALRWLRAATAGRLLHPDGPSLRLTERGAFWIHWMQNQFILRTSTRCGGGPCAIPSGPHCALKLAERCGTMWRCTNSALRPLRGLAQNCTLLRRRKSVKGSAFAQSRKSEERGQTAAEEKEEKRREGSIVMR